MKIQLNNVGKKFRNVWIFKNLNFSFSQGKHYVILGANGSGKSTLLQILSGMTLPSEGDVSYTLSGEVIQANDVYQKMMYAAPYVDLFNQLNLKEILKVHSKFKKFCNQMTIDEVIENMELSDHQDRPIDVFSSGMKQRVKLGLAIMSESSLLFLDEPLTNLDEKGKIWYHSMIDKFMSNRMIIVSSNHQEAEYAFCDHIYNL